jgi:hypothetical protein
MACGQLEQERIAEPVSASRWTDADFIGSYHHKGFGALRIEPGADSLWFRIDRYPKNDAPLVRYSGLSFEWQGNDDVWPPATAPTPLEGHGARVRFFTEDDEIAGLDWHCWWFGTARFLRKRTSS